LLIGSKRLTPRISIAAHSPVASENGPAAGTFVLTRTGPTDAALTINVLLTGSAVNGVDYEYVPGQITFAVGARTTNIVIAPYPDTITENAEVVQALVQSGPDYVLGSTSSAQLTIEDLAPLITIETLDQTAVKNPQRPGYFLISRSGILDRSVFVQLTVGGRAANGSDYDSIPTFVNFSPFQTAVPIQINPKSTAVLQNGAESVRITVRTNSAYKVSGAGQAAMMIVDHEQTFADWKAANFPNDSSAVEVFALGDFGLRNVRNLQRYAYQLDPLSPQLIDPRMPKFQFLTNGLSVVFRRSAALTDVQFVVEVSQDLTAWHSDASHVEQYFPAEYANDPDMICVRAKDPSTMQFMRVRVLYAP
jgi:hypothetical protein